MLETHNWVTQWPSCCAIGCTGWWWRRVVITSLIQHGDEGPDRLLGCYLADGDMVRGAALAVLNATNRVLGNYIMAH